jgi:penicillin-binding protein 1A
MLQDAVRSGTGKPAALPKITVFGKTGTSNDFIDAWFSGGVPGMTTVVYVGRDDNKPIGRRAFGGTVAAPVWKKFMTYATELEDTPANFPNAPSWVEVSKVSICRTSGYLARKGCPAVPLYIPAGKAPTASCPIHGGSYAAADADPRGPRLFLVDQDDAYLARMEKEENEEQAQQPVVAQQPVAPVPQSAIPSASPIPSPSRNPTPAAEIERRYQELLKQYGIE